ncbi:MAG: cob(I)yrinic acid a,c-diamide adenosyltransferase [candidate division Zixibacteria bacterium]|nr:cob(I)yrinic acid a,c-diamide adenosyltransferase [candidate division Zixibacteria bacterium]
MKIYTKTGDSGETGLLGGDRVGKDDYCIHAYGTVDECNAILGIVQTFTIESDLKQKLNKIQNLLFVVGSDLATPDTVSTAVDRIGEDEISLLEKWIDEYEEKLPQLKQFIIQGGTPAASYLHLARTVCRRAERWAVTASKDNIVNKHVLKLLNRLSDFLFVAARMANFQAGVNDIPWDNPRLKKGK